jgi:glutamine synthetase adenylyltransferase
MSSETQWIQPKASGTLNPAQVQNSLERISESWPVDGLPLRDLLEQFPLGETSLLHLLAVSSICAARLVRQPDILLWLSDPEICSAPRSYSAMLKYLRETGGDSVAAENFRALRVWKGREMFRSGGGRASRRDHA